MCWSIFAVDARHFFATWCRNCRKAHTAAHARLAQACWQGHDGHRVNWRGRAAAVRHPRGQRASRLRGGTGWRASRPQACRRTNCRLPACKHAPQTEPVGGPRQGDVAGLKGDVARALRALGEAPAGAGSAVAALAELERVKARMEAACSTLKAPPAAPSQPPPAGPSPLAFPLRGRAAPGAPAVLSLVATLLHGLPAALHRPRGAAPTTARCPAHGRTPPGAQHTAARAG